MVKVAPSILAADFTRLTEQIRTVQSAGADMLHIDVMDGHFVPNLTFGPFIIKQIDQITNLPLDVHLMISNPEKYIDVYIDAGADLLTVHGEVIGRKTQLLDGIRAKGAKPGLSLNPDADLRDYLDLLRHVDLFLVMSVYAGFGGQEFIPDVLTKVKMAVDFRQTNQLDYEIAIDGGINLDTAVQARTAGVDIMVAGTALFGSTDIAKFIRKLRQ